MDNVIRTNAQAHPLGRKIECPHCGWQLYTEILGDPTTCSNCEGEFTINQNGEFTGVHIECPHCIEVCYYELSGEAQVICHECEDKFTLDEHNRFVGGTVTCPYCDEMVYTELFGTPFSCPECDEKFTAVDPRTLLTRPLSDHSGDSRRDGMREPKRSLQETGVVQAVIHAFPLGSDIECPTVTISFIRNSLTSQ